MRCLVIDSDTTDAMIYLIANLHIPFREPSHVTVTEHRAFTFAPTFALLPYAEVDEFPNSLCRYPTSLIPAQVSGHKTIVLKVQVTFRYM